MREKFVGEIALPVKYNRRLLLLIDVLRTNTTIEKIAPIAPFIIRPLTNVMPMHVRPLKQVQRILITRMAGKEDDDFFIRETGDHLGIYLFCSTHSINWVKTKDIVFRLQRMF